MSLTDLAKEDFEELLFGFEDNFTAKLLRLIMKADSENLEKLRLAFPEEVEAYEIWQKGLWGGGPPI